MAQSGYTPLSLYYSATASSVPTAGNLVAGELALNTADGKLFYKDSSGNVQVIASKAGNVNVSSFSGGTTGLTPNTATTGAVTLAGTLAVANGGTGQTTASAAFNALSPITTTGDLIIGNGTNSATRLGIGTNGYVLTSNGTTASWAAATGGVTQIIAGTNVTISPSGGTGAVTINATGASSAYTRTSFTATAGQTTFSVTYTVGYLQVYLNGVFLNASDYTASNGTSVVLAVAANAGDIIETVAYNTVAIGTASAISGGAASQLVYQTGANTTGFIANGTSGQVLTSNGTSAPSWATPSSGAMTLISTKTASTSANLSWTGLSGYDKYQLIFENLLFDTNSNSILIQFGTGSSPTYLSSGYTYYFLRGQSSTATAGGVTITGTYGVIASYATSTFYSSSGIATITGTTSLGNVLSVSSYTPGGAVGAASTSISSGGVPITAIQIFPGAGNFASGTASLYGIAS